MTSREQCPRGGACECPRVGVFFNFSEGLEKKIFPACPLLATIDQIHGTGLKIADAVNAKPVM